MTDQMRVALIRSFIQAFIQFGGGFFSIYIATDDMKAALVGAGLAAFIAIGYRGVAEGNYDQTRDAAGHVTKADVTPNPAPADVDRVDMNDPRLGINRARA